MKLNFKKKLQKIVENRVENLNWNFFLWKFFFSPQKKVLNIRSGWLFSTFFSFFFLWCEKKEKRFFICDLAIFFPTSSHCRYCCCCFFVYFVPVSLFGEIWEKFWNHFSVNFNKKLEVCVKKSNFKNFLKKKIATK